MIKKLKLGLLIAVLSLAVGVSSANAAPLNFTDDTIVTVNGMNFTILAGSEADSVVVNPTTLVVGFTAAGSDSFTLTSPTGLTLGASGGTTTCGNGSVTTNVITATSTVTYTPTATVQCVVSGGGGLSSGSGSGGTTSGDVTAPINGSVSINAGANTTSSLNVTLGLTASDNVAVTQMMVSNDAGFTGASWESYSVSKPWTLVSGDGSKTVYVQFRDAAGNTSATASDTITVSGSGTSAPVITVTPVTIVWVPGCSGTVGYSTTTGQSCANYTTTTTGSPVVTVIQGCGNSNVGFSTTTGQSCAYNYTSGSMTIPGCNNGTGGFSTVSGQSCATNYAPGVTWYAFGDVTLKSGSSGPAVMELQRFLNRFLNLGLVVDGKLGPKTIAVVKKWQADHGLVADGLVGAKTKAQMNAVAAVN